MLTMAVAGSTVVTTSDMSTQIPEMPQPIEEYTIVDWYMDTATTSANAQSAQVQEEPKEKQVVVDDDVRLLCNCYAYVKEVFNELPHTSTIKTNLSEVGNVAVFYYPTSGVYHYAVVTDRTADKISIDETNFKHCQLTRRIISEDDPYLLGFYSV